MNEPIISPWLIYWIGRVHMVHCFSLILGLLLTFLAAVIGFLLIINNNDCIDDCIDDYSDDANKPALNFLKKIACVALIFDALTLFIPSQTEIIAMYAAKNITPANIKATGEFADKAVDKLIEKILKASEAMGGHKND